MIPDGYRELTPSEVARLTGQGCFCEDWDRVKVAPGFNPARVLRTTLSGDVFLGNFTGSVSLGADAPLHPSGVFDSFLHDVYIDDEALVCRVALLSNYRIGKGAVVFDVGSMTASGSGENGLIHFGNGVEVAVINEGGGREVVMHEYLTAQEGYLSAVWHHKPGMVKGLTERAKGIAASLAAEYGEAGEGSRIICSGLLHNVRVAPGCVVEGASRLENGTLCNNGTPSRIGSGVEARDFILASGAVVDGGASLLRAFVGECSHIGRGFTATDSLFFANCSLEGGEACSLLAGPFTVSHHKSTLLIATATSFFNAGSGTNQSNHNYKLGPLHQGFFERGAKTGSGSYIFWPARIGAGSVVVGHHSTHPDTTSLPFSYLLERDGSPVLVPGAALRNVGLIRDDMKWRKRDARVGRKADFIVPTIFNPYTMGRIAEGLDTLSSIAMEAPANGSPVDYFDYRISRSDLQAGISSYRMALDIYIGDIIVRRFRQDPKSITRGRVAGLSKTPFGSSGRGIWCDICGLPLPIDAVEALADEIAGGEEFGRDALRERFEALSEAYSDWEWNWMCGCDTPSKLDIAHLMERWIDAREQLVDIYCRDAAREFDFWARIGYGIDEELLSYDDFTDVRGPDPDSHPLIRTLRGELEECRAVCAEIMRHIK